VVSEPGGRIIVWSWATTALFTVVAALDAFGVPPFDQIAPWACFALFVVSLGIWLYAFGLAVVRSTRGDDISVATLFFLSSGAAPALVRKHLMAALGVAIVVGLATVKSNPTSILVPMLPLGLAGMWSARHGTFPPRAGFDRASTSAPRRSDGRPRK
jgi:hypothetical protein